MSRWSVNTYTFTSVGDYPYTIEYHTLSLDDYLISGKLTKTLNDTSKVTFSVPDAQGANLYPGQTLVDVKFGNDRKFFGTVTKKTYNQNGIYSFEATGVLGSYQFIPNYDGYDNETIETYIATEMSRFKGTASAPYACDNPWTLLYTGHDEIPSTFGDIETENLGLIPSFNLNLQKTSANAYEFLKMITRDKNYILPSSVTENETASYWYEDGEKAYFKRISGFNAQVVRYTDNLISYSSNAKTKVSKVYAKNTVIESPYPSEQSQNIGRYPVPFNYKRVNLSEKNDKRPYTSDEMSQILRRNFLQDESIEAVAFDKHIIDQTVDWLDMGKMVNVQVFQNGEAEMLSLNIVQIDYDLCDSSKDRVKLGTITNNYIASETEQDNDFKADIEGKLDTSGGSMTGAIEYDETENDINNTNTIDVNEIHLSQTDESVSASDRVLESSVDITPLGLVPDSADAPINYQPYVSVSRKYGASSATATRNTTTLNGFGVASQTFDANGVRTSYTIINPAVVGMSDGKHTLQMMPEKIAMDSDRYAITDNSLDSSLIEQGSLNVNDGTEQADSVQFRTGFSSVKANTQYTASINSGFRYQYLYEFDSSKAFICSVVLSSTDTATFTTGSTTKFVRFMGDKYGSTIVPSEITSAKLEKGSSKTPWNPYTMSATEVASHLTWKRLGTWSAVGHSVSLPSDANEILIVPTIHGAVCGGQTFIADVIGSLNQGGFVQDGTYNTAYTFSKSGLTLTCTAFVKQGWTNVLFTIYAR